MIPVMKELDRQEDYARPASLQPGREYFWLERALDYLRRVRVVRLVAYDPCPAFVIVEDEGGRRRCLREEIFEGVLRFR